MFYYGHDDTWDTIEEQIKDIKTVAATVEDGVWTRLYMLVVKKQAIGMCRQRK